MAEVVRISGETGEGIITLGEIFAKALLRSGYEIFTFRTYPAEVRSGLTMFQIRFDREEVYSQGDEVDLLLVFNEEAYNNEEGDLKKDGVLLYDADAFEPEQKRGIGLPFTSVSKGHPKNMVALGCLAHIYSFNIELIRTLLRERFVSSQKVLDSDLEAFLKGIELSAERIPELKRGSKSQHIKNKKLLLSGNEAICLGAIAAGMKYFAGYPITPASDILEFFASNLPDFGGMTIQTEDELAALGSAIGASYAGHKAMVATSGPGLSLMAELVDYASMAEIPVVIVDCQRGGPSTGLPTKTEQSDLAHSIFGGHGEAPRIVLAPFNVEDCFFQTIRAFNLAEECQMPVILLSDQSISHRLESVEFFNRKKVEIRERVKTPIMSAERFERYKLTADGVSPVPIPGEHDILFITTGIEHDEFGKPNYDPNNRQRMVEKRYKKLEKALRYSEIVTHGNSNSEIKLMSWGSTEGPVREAVERANEKGISVSSIHPKLLYPLPKNKITEFLGDAKRIIVPEVNYTGQFARLLRSELEIEVKGLNQYGGLPFKPREILERIEEAAHAK